jgi:CheY-like chemotaxis protein
LGDRNACPDPPGAISSFRREVVILVDEIVGPEEVVVRPLPPLLRGQRCFSGATLSGTGEIVLLLDSASLCQWALRHLDGEPGLSRSAAPRDGNSSEPPTFLIVDDSLSARRSLAQMLQSRGFQAVEAVDGADAVQRIQSQRFAAVFSDLEMPRRSGFELLQEVKSDPDMQSLPVVIVSGRHEEEFRTRARELGAIAYLTKPLNARILGETLAQLTGAPCVGA